MTELQSVPDFTEEIVLVSPSTINCCYRPLHCLLGTGSWNAMRDCSSMLLSVVLLFAKVLEWPYDLVQCLVESLLAMNLDSSSSLKNGSSVVSSFSIVETVL